MWGVFGKVEMWWKFVLIQKRLKRLKNDQKMIKMSQKK